MAIVGVLISLFVLFIQAFAMGQVSLIAISNLTNETREFQGPCGAKPTISNDYAVEEPAKLYYSSESAGNTNSYQDQYLNLTLDSTGQASCWPWTASIRTTKIELWIHELSGNASWIAGCDVLWRTELSQNPQTVINTINTCLNTDLGGGLKYIGWFSIDWPMVPNLTLKAKWDLMILDHLAQYSQGEQVQFLVRITLTYDAYNGQWWYGNNVIETYNLNSQPAALSSK